MINALTIDLEDWYQGLTSTNPHRDLWPVYEDRIVANTEWLLGVLSQAGIKATFFVLGYVADQFPELVKKIADYGHEIGLHSYYHQRVNRLTKQQFREDVSRGLEVVQKISGKIVQGYRAPMFSINGSSTWILKELRDMGFRYDSSLFPIRNFYYGDPGVSRFPYFPLKDNSFIEFPLSTFRYLNITWPIAGGFYGRVMPLRIIRAGINQLNDQGHPAVIYFHPWEFDTEQHFSKVTLRERITHYYGRAGLKSKFMNLLHEFKFGPLSALLDHIA